MRASEHFDHLERLLEVERVAENQENLRELSRYPIATREALGKTVTGLILQRTERGMGGMTLISFSRKSAGEEMAPFHAMSNGDNVLVTFPSGSTPPTAQGTLYRVDEYDATVAVNSPSVENAFSDNYARGTCQIDLLGSDVTYRRMKAALKTVAQAKKSELAELRDISLSSGSPGDMPSFPRKRKSRTHKLGPRLRIAGTTRRDFSFFNDGLNVYQKEAVEKCLAAERVALVHGPPGTGKTTVLVEIIRQAAAAGDRVLATAPSNVAVDNILEKLHESPIRVVRLGHPARTMEFLRHNNLAALVEADPAYEEVREMDFTRERLAKKKSRFGRGQLGYDEKIEREREIRKLWTEARAVEFAISRRILASAQVVLGTHAGISTRLVKGGFDLVALDEASQASEPLSWVALTLGRKAVFTGDSQQLPPTIYSKEAAEDGLSITLFDRFKEVLPESGQTLLRVQYRMHEAIMGFSSQEFYDGKLIADESVRLHTVAELPGVTADELTSKPVVFVDTAGAGFDEAWNELLESRENRGEAELVVRLMERLLKSGIAPRNLALLTPYVAQAKLLKSLVKIPGLEIGSVDGFQGREKEATIVSLVRSNAEGEIGFLGDTRRMNVAMTRARRLLIVVGDSATIGRNPFYERFLDYVGRLDSHRSAYEWP